MRPGDEIAVRFSALDSSGDAVAHVGGRRLLVPGGLPGEQAAVRLTQAGEGDAELAGEVVRLVEPSPQRVTPRCRHAADCGGCSWQHIAYPEQLRLKREALQALLRGTLGERAPRVAPTLGMAVGEDGAPWGFRQKAAFVFAPQPGGGLAMGHFARRTNRVVPVEECPVHSPRANRIAFALRDALARARVPAAGPEGGLLRHVLVRTSADEREAVAVLVATRDDPSLHGPLERAQGSAGSPTGVLLNLHDRPGPYLVGRETLRVSGQGHVREAGLGPSFLVSPTGFFQTNVAAAALLLRLVRAALPPRPGLQLLDLYAGSGLFALPLAQDGHSVTAVEESRKALRDAARNGRLNGVREERLRLVCARVEDALPGMLRRRFDAVILDPPRQGCPPRVLESVTRRLAPERVVLVSCNPEALARELALALRSGYRAELVQPVDMFPHTPHIETVAVLQRRPQRGAGSRAGAPLTPAAGRPARPPGSPSSSAARSRAAGGRRGSGRGAAG